MEEKTLNNHTKEVESSYIKYAKPSHLTLAPYLTVWTYINDKHHKEYFVQVSQQDGMAEWVSMAEYLLMGFYAQLENKEFIDAIALMYQNNKSQFN